MIRFSSPTCLRVSPLLHAVTCRTGIRVSSLPAAALLPSSRWLTRRVKPVCRHLSPPVDNALQVGDGTLTADELWRPSCDLLKDMLDTANMDPHLILLVFLPVLLFESAFAIDLGILRTQVRRRHGTRARAAACGHGRWHVGAVGAIWAR